MLWYLSSGNPSAQTLYIEEAFSRIRFGWLLTAFGLLLATGGALMIHFWGYRSVTQNWLALIAILSAVFLVAIGVKTK